MYFLFIYLFYLFLFIYFYLFIFIYLFLFIYYLFIIYLFIYLLTNCLAWSRLCTNRGQLEFTSAQDVYSMQQQIPAKFQQGRLAFGRMAPEKNLLSAYIIEGHGWSTADTYSTVSFKLMRLTVMTFCWENLA